MLNGFSDMVDGGRIIRCAALSPGVGYGTKVPGYIGDRVQLVIAAESAG